jgi:tRNA-modifying protein YgfZ
MQGYYSYKTGILKVTGKDKLDYFNRISTNRFTSFPEMTYIKTVFPNDKGRIIDLCTVLNYNDTFYLICTPGNDEKLKKHIDKYTVTEDIEVIRDYGFITYFTGIEDFYPDFKPNSNAIRFIENSFILKDNYGFAKTTVISRGQTNNEFMLKLTENAKKISSEDFFIYSTKYFKLYRPNELNDDNNPLECYLDDYISFDKGCYIGQEVISRINSQRKIPKYLVNIQSNFKFNERDLIYTKINNQETECGHITSSVEKDGQFYGYGFIKSIVLQNNNIFQTNGKEIFINYKYT